MMNIILKILINTVISFHKEYNHQNQNSISFWYFCSQRTNLKKKPRKHADPNNQRDTPKRTV